ncbi:MAG: class II fructose-bisphosphate aldolase [Sedimentisphaerales bacterium]|nr:class II fructose-bisphosphate aldolase [Sedimentisphaerales bacterium]
MTVINDYTQVKEIYSMAVEKGVGLPVFCSEDRETVEAILASAYEYGQEIGVDDLPIIVAWTNRYPCRGQMTLLTACGDPVLGNKLMFSDLAMFADSSSPYRKLRVMPHLDHAFPWLDEDIMLGFADQFASVMCDASEKPFEENIRLTADYVEKVKNKVVVEGAVDEIFESGGEGEKNEPTSVEQAKRYLAETGVDVIVPNVGTEHRATAGNVVYLSDQARKLKEAVGPIMCIHGTSSVKPEDLQKLPGDGFVKINIYTTIAIHGGQALTREVLQNLANILPESELRELVNQGVLTEKAFSMDYGQNRPPFKPKLDVVCNPLRRDEWFKGVKNRCKEFLEIFNYSKFAGM